MLLEQSKQSALKALGLDELYSSVKATVKLPANRTKEVPDVSERSTKTILKDFHAKDWKGYPATSAAQALGIILEITKAQREQVFRLMMLLDLQDANGNVSESIRRTIVGNCAKHLDLVSGNRTKVTSRPCYISPLAIPYIKKVWSMLLKYDAEYASRIARQASGSDVSAKASAEKAQSSAKSKAKRTSSKRKAS